MISLPLILLLLCANRPYADDTTTVVFPFRSLSDLNNRMDNQMSHMQQWSTSNGFRLYNANLNEIPSQLRFPHLTYMTP